MALTHSWKWLAPRLTSRKKQKDHPAAGASRPPLASIEPLDDRILLSAATEGGSGDVSSLVAVLQGGTNVAASQINLLNACSQGKHIKKVDIVLLDSSKIDTLLYKAEQELLGDGSVRDLQKFQTQIAGIFSDISSLLPDLVPPDLQDQASSLLQQIQGQTNDLLGTLSQITGDQLTSKETLDYLKVSDAFQKIDIDFLKAGASDVFIKGESQDDKHKDEIAAITDLFNKADQLITNLSGDAAAQLLPVVQQTQQQIIAILIGHRGGGGVTTPTALPDNMGDVIA